MEDRIEQGRQIEVMQPRSDVSQTNVRNPTKCINLQRPRLIFPLHYFCTHRSPEGQSVQETIVPPYTLDGSSNGRTQYYISEQDNRRGGWRSMSFILGNDLCESLASAGTSLNMITYLTTKYNMHQVTGTTVLSITSGTSSLTPLLVAYLSDVYFGRFWTIVAACIANAVAGEHLAF
eukprot:c53694_g1_i1 orf=58-588(+)